LGSGDILTDGEGRVGGKMMPPPERVRGMQPEVLQTLPGYDSDVDQWRADARTGLKRSWPVLRALRLASALNSVA
jgi:peptide/nickel transport system substrate-binding protein